MKNKYYVSLFCLFWIFIGMISVVRGQSITFDNVPPYGTGSTAVTNGGYFFNFTTNKKIALEAFRLVSSSGVYNITIWYSTQKINGTPDMANINQAGGWNSLGTVSHNGSGIGAIATIPLSISLNMEPGDTFAFFIEQSAGSVYPTTNVNTPIYTDGTVSI